MKSFHEREGFQAPNPELQISLPPQVILAASHASRDVPPTFLDGHTADFELSHALTANLVLQKDFSDFSTGLILDWFDPRSTVFPRFGRIAGDPNRALGADDLLRTTTMGGIIDVWEAGKEPDDFTKILWLDVGHKLYYEKITARVLQALDETEKDRQILFVDLHDTGDFRFLPNGDVIAPSPRLASFNRDRFYTAVVSNRDGLTASEDVTNAFIKNLIESYQVAGLQVSDGEIDINGYYKGGNVTNYVGSTLKHMLANWGREDDANRLNALQLEIPRSRVMSDERSQEVDPAMIAHEAQLIGSVLIHTANDI